MEHNITPPRVRIQRTMQVRFFQERNLEALQDTLNEWLAQRADREIVEIHQSVLAEPGGRAATDREVIVSVWYIED